MFCSKCGKENPDGNAVCFSCGEPLTQAAPASAPQPQAQPAPTASANPTPQAAPAPAPQPTPQPAPAPAPQATATQPQQIYAKGCIGCAWEDIRKSDGWVGRTLLLGLINIVPILNWIVSGYCMRWARQLPMGKIQSMPKQVFVNRGFVNGAFYFVLTLVFSLVSGIATSILMLVPILGWLAGIALGVFISMFLNVALLRSAVADRLGAGFDLGAMWPAIKRSPGSLLCITIVPSIIIGLAIGIIGFIIVMIAIAMVGGDIYQLAMMADYYDDFGYGYGYGHGYDPTFAILGILGTLLPAVLIVYIIGCFGMAFYQVLVFRAMGHWVARYAPEWMSDPTVTASMNLYPDAPAPQPVQPQTPPQA